MGVNRALSLCTNLIKDKVKPIYTLGPLIHNNDVINKLESLDVQSESNINKIPENACVLIRSHGITPELKHELSGFKLCDATCPKVAKVQGLIRQHIGNAYFVLIIGDHEHAETKGLIAHTKGQGLIISNKKELDKFINTTDPEEKICVVAQTTQDLDFFNDFCDILKNNFINIKIINTICEATRNRQDEVKLEAAKYDRVIVVGAKHSANTTRLYQVAKSSGAKLLDHIEGFNELGDIDKNERILITGGASTPLWLIYNIRNKLLEKMFINKILFFLGSSFVLNTFAIVSIVLYLIFNQHMKLITAILLLLASVGIQNYHQKKIDVLFQKDFKVLLYLSMILLFFQSINVNVKNIFFLFYYLSLIYVIYINPIISKEVIRVFCSVLFIILALI